MHHPIMICYAQPFSVILIVKFLVALPLYYFVLIFLFLTAFSAFPARNHHVEVFWFVIPCSVVVGYQHFRGLWTFTTVKTSKPQHIIC